MIFHDLYIAIENLSFSLEGLCAPAMKRVTEKYHLADFDLLLFTALPALNPGAINTLALHALFPFTSPRLIQNCLASFDREQLLVCLYEDHYVMSSQADSLALWITKEINNALSSLQPMPATRMMDMASQLKELADACYAAPEPPARLQMTSQRKLTPAGTIPMMARLNQIVRELVAYRADAHQTAWQAYGVDGHAWEILSLLWQNKKMKLADLYRSLEYRGFSHGETLAALGELSKRGWASGNSDEGSITPFGAEVRQIAEATTDRYYFAPWQKFTETRLNALKILVDDFRRGIPDLSGK
jgi:hypothetical protein